MATITKDIIALAKKIDSAQEWDMVDCMALCEALDMGDEWDAADSETFESVIEKAIDKALWGDAARLSVDNGVSYIAADEGDELQAAIDEVGWDTIVSAMDDDAREQAHREVAPCTELDFLEYYLEIALHDLVIGQNCKQEASTMKKTIESIEKEITVEDVMAALRENVSTDWEERDFVPYVYYYLHLDSKGIKPDYWCATDDTVSTRMSVESYVDELICDVELPSEDDRDEDDYGDCTEGWQIKLCVRYGVTAYRDLDWSKIVGDIEEREDGIFYDIASDLAAQANAWIEDVDD